MEGSYSKCNVQNAPRGNFQTEVVDGLDRFSPRIQKKYQLSLLKLDWQEQLQARQYSLLCFFVIFQEKNAPASLLVYGWSPYRACTARCNQDVFKKLPKKYCLENTSSFKRKSNIRKAVCVKCQ